MAWVTVEVLDGIYGQAAGAIRVRLDRAEKDEWMTIVRGQTDIQGRIDDWDYTAFGRGLYRIVLDNDSYFAALGLSTAYPEVQIMFRIRDGFDRCRIQVMLAPYSYSTQLSAISDASR